MISRLKVPFFLPLRWELTIEQHNTRPKWFYEHTSQSITAFRKLSSVDEEYT